MEKTIFVKEGNEFVEKEIAKIEVYMSSAFSFQGFRRAITIIHTSDGCLYKVINEDKFVTAQSNKVFLTETDAIKNKIWQGFLCNEVLEVVKKKYKDKDVHFIAEFSTTFVQFCFYKWDGNNAARFYKNFNECHFEYDFSNNTFKVINEDGEIDTDYTFGRYKNPQECIEDNKVIIKRLPKKEETKKEERKKLYLVLNRVEHFVGNIKSTIPFGVFDSEEKALEAVKNIVDNTLKDSEPNKYHIEYSKDKTIFLISKPNYNDIYEVHNVLYYDN